MPARPAGSVGRGDGPAPARLRRSGARRPRRRRAARPTGVAHGAPRAVLGRTDLFLPPLLGGLTDGLLGLCWPRFPRPPYSPGQPSTPSGAPLGLLPSPRSGGRRTFSPGAGWICASTLSCLSRQLSSRIYPDHLSRPPERAQATCRRHLPRGGVERSGSRLPLLPDQCKPKELLLGETTGAQRPCAAEL